MSDLKRQHLKRQHEDVTAKKTELDARYFELKNQLRITGAELEQKRMELEELELELAEHEEDDDDEPES